MFRDFFTNKWILGGLGFLVIFAGLCYLWYQHTTAPYREQVAELDEIIRQFDSEQTATTATSTEKADNASANSSETTVEKPITATTQDNEPTNIETNTDNSVVSDTTEDVRMSPHGFGPYPKIPEGSSIGPFLEEQNAQQELIGRVLVKLWNEGDRHTGGGVFDAEQGKVYPYYPNVLYVKYENEFNVITDQYETKVVEITTSPENADAADSVMRGVVPSGYTLIDIEKSGINPYVYLDLP